MLFFPFLFVTFSVSVCLYIKIIVITSTLIQHHRFQCSLPPCLFIPGTYHLKYIYLALVVVQSLSHVQLFKTHGLQRARFSCPSPSLGVYSNSCPLSQGCHPTISSSVALFSSCPQFFSASGSFPVSWLFTSDGQSTGASALAAVLPMNIQG